MKFKKTLWRFRSVCLIQATYIILNFLSQKIKNHVELSTLFCYKKYNYCNNYD